MSIADNEAFLAVSPALLTEAFEPPPGSPDYPTDSDGSPGADEGRGSQDIWSTPFRDCTPPKLYGTKVVLQVLGVSRPTLRRMMRSTPPAAQPWINVGTERAPKFRWRMDLIFDWLRRFGKSRY